VAAAAREKGEIISDKAGLNMGEEGKIGRMGKQVLTLISPLPTLL